MYMYVCIGSELSNNDSLISSLSLSLLCFILKPCKRKDELNNDSLIKAILCC